LEVAHASLAGFDVARVSGCLWDGAGGGAS